MTIQSVITELENKGATNVEQGDSRNELGADIHRIYYDPPESRPNVAPKRQTMELNEKNGVIKYHMSIPPILREAATPVDQREFILTEQETIDAIKSHYIAENGGT